MPRSKRTIPIKQTLPAPCELPPDEAAEYARLAEVLGERLKPEDAYPIAMLATAWVTWRTAQADVARDGRVVMSGGTACPHPALSVAAQAHSQIVQLAKELGLTPASRKKLPKAVSRKDKPEWLSA